MAKRNEEEERRPRLPDPSSGDEADQSDTEVRKDSGASSDEEKESGDDQRSAKEDEEEQEGSPLSEGEFEVERIMDKRVIRRSRGRSHEVQYLIRWKGYDANHDTW